MEIRRLEVAPLFDTMRGGDVVQSWYSGYVEVSL
jgi:hypothetical protein